VATAARARVMSLSMIVSRGPSMESKKVSCFNNQNLAVGMVRKFYFEWRVTNVTNPWPWFYELNTNFFQRRQQKIYIFEFNFFYNLITRKLVRSEKFC
jgi:hypothetical protein